MRFYLTSTVDDIGNRPIDGFADFTSWLVVAVSGFMDFTLFGGFTIGDMLGTIVAFSFVMLFLKFFAGVNMDIFVEVLDMCANHIYPTIMTTFSAIVDILTTPFGHILDQWVYPWWSKLFPLLHPGITNVIDFIIPNFIEEMSLLSVLGGTMFVAFVALTFIKWVIGIVM